MTEPTSLAGAPLPTIPFDVQHEYDLEYLEGPLLAVCRAASGDAYIEMWVERFENARGPVNRFFLFRVSEREVLEYRFRKRTLRQTLRQARDGFGFFRDKQKGQDVAVWMTPIQQFPADYIPDEDSWHDESVSPSHAEAGARQFFLVDGSGWEIDTFKEFQKKFRQTYSFISAFTPTPVSEDKRLKSSLPMKSFESGWNYGQAFDDLFQAIPKEARIRGLKIQYQSPGYMSFEVHPNVARDLRSSLDALRKNRKEVWKRYDSVHEIVKAIKRELKDALANGRAVEVNKFDDRLEAPSSALASSLGVVNYQRLRELSASAYVAGELLVTFVRRMNELLAYERREVLEILGDVSEATEDGRE